MDKNKIFSPEELEIYKHIGFGFKNVHGEYFL